ncbi:PAS domain S-box protein, partial [Listeria monocytogenes]|nr:PAS domain S-box protein [Listeria monocytogenes]
MKFTLDETQNNRLLAAIFQELAVIVFDPQKEVVFANANMTDILGYSQEEIIGLPHRTFCFDHYAVSTDYQAFWNQLLYSKQRFQDKIIRKNKQGEKLILEGIYFPVLDEQQEVVNVVKIAFDITQREQALAVTIKKVQESAASLTRLSANGHQQVDHLSENLAQVKRLSDQNQATTHALEMD